VQAPKAESAGKSATDDEALDFADTVNDADVLRKFMFLIRGDLFIMRCRMFDKSRLDSRVTKSDSVSLLSTG
jgi:hypothetical protein